ncbi:MAG: class I SAM-dependent methyltransferase [Myxococcota bacterium]
MLLGTRAHFDYFECGACGCVQLAAPACDEADVDERKETYPADYYTKMREPRIGRVGGVLGWRRHWTRFRLGSGGFGRLLSGRRYARFDWFRRTGTRMGDKILDVGCGSGRLLARMRADGFEDLTGLDPDLDSEKGARPGLRWISTSLAAEVGSGAEEGEYDLVMAHHSFEHMSDPRAAMQALASLLRDGGFILLRIPRADSWAYRHYGADWSQLDAPRHTHLFTRRSIEILCAAAGLRIAHVEDDSGPFQIWGSELYRRDIALSESRARPAGQRLRHRLQRLAARRKARALQRQGLGDQACFYLEKREPGGRGGGSGSGSGADAT